MILNNKYLLSVDGYSEQRFDGFYNNLVAPTLGSAGKYYTRAWDL